jgi:hypothetical protein
MKFLKALGGLLCAIGCIVALAGILATAAPMIDNDQVSGVIDSFSMQSDNRFTSAVNAAATFCLAQNYLVFGLGIVTLLIGGLMRTGAERALYATHTDAPETEATDRIVDGNEPQQPEATDRKPPQSAATDRKQPHKSPPGQMPIPRIEHRIRNEETPKPASEDWIPAVKHDEATEELIASILNEKPVTDADANTNEEVKPQTFVEIQSEEARTPTQAETYIPEGYNPERGENQPDTLKAEPETSLPQEQPATPEPASLQTAAPEPATPEIAEPEPSSLWPAVPEPVTSRSAAAEHAISPKPLPPDAIMTAKPSVDPHGAQPDHDAPVHAEWSYHPPVVETQADKPVSQRSISAALADWETKDNGDERVIIATRKTAELPTAETAPEPINAVVRDAVTAKPVPISETPARPTLFTSFHAPTADSREPSGEPIFAGQRQAPEPLPTAEAQPVTEPPPAADKQPVVEPQPVMTPQSAETQKPSVQAPLSRLVSREGRPRVVTTLPNLRFDGDETLPDLSGRMSNEVQKLVNGTSAQPDTDRPKIVSTMGKRNL